MYYINNVLYTESLGVTRLSVAVYMACCNCKKVPLMWMKTVPLIIMEIDNFLKNVKMAISSKIS